MITSFFIGLTIGLFIFYFLSVYMIFLDFKRHLKLKISFWQWIDNWNWFDDNYEKIENIKEIENLFGEEG